VKANKENISKLRHVLYCISKNKFTIFVLALILLCSCNSEQEHYPNPSIMLVHGEDYLTSDTTILLGDTVIVSIIAETNSEVALSHFNISYEFDGVEASIDTGIYDVVFNFQKRIVKGIADIENWSFYVRDREGRQSETIELTLTKDAQSQFGDIRFRPLVIFGAHNNNSLGSFYSFETDSIYFQNDAYEHQNLINLLYYYDFIELDENTIASPGANIDESVFPGLSGLHNWSIKNTTRFLLQENLTVIDFDNCENDSLILSNTFEFASGKRKAKNLSSNQIFSFVTEEGERGLFKVNTVSGHDEGEIQLSIKMQQ